MALFSPVHFDALVNSYWQNQHPCCPHDGKPLDTRFHQQTTSYLLVMACNYCGRKAQFTRFSDPQCYQFRPWTTPEIAALSAAYQAKQTPQCPVCRAKVGCREICPDTDVTLECLRCGNLHL